MWAFLMILSDGGTGLCHRDEEYVVSICNVLRIEIAAPVEVEGESEKDAETGKG